jgi:hypothetical protein
VHTVREELADRRALGCAEERRATALRAQARENRVTTAELRRVCAGASEIHDYRRDTSWLHDVGVRDS